MQVVQGISIRQAVLLLAVTTCCGRVDPAVDTADADVVISLLGEELQPLVLSEEVVTDRRAKLAEARQAFDRDPGNEDAIIWHGRRLAYLGAYREAIAVYSDGLAHHPDSYRLRRHRGHRYLTVRRIDDAIADLTRAAQLIENVPDEVEPDGLPNDRGIPTSTSHTNIYYHLGLAHHVKGNWREATDSYRSCITFSRNDDMQCAARYWLYLTLRRQGLDEEAETILAPINADMDLIENTSYWQLLRLFKGELAPEDVTGGASPVGQAIDNATVAYGVASWYRLQGEHERSQELLRRIVEGPAWPAFGHLAAEADLAAGR